MNLNKSTRFALYALIALAREAPEKLNVQEIAARFRVSEHHLSKVMQALTRAGYVDGLRGAAGGYQLARDPKAITVMDVIRVFEPDFLSNDCQLKSGQEDCGREHSCCSLRNLFSEISLQVSATFTAVTIDTLARQEMEAAPSRSAGPILA
jgi:Rrf2 family protein